MEPVKDANPTPTQNLDSCAEPKKLLTGSNNQTSTLHSPEYTHDWKKVAGRLQYLCNKHGDFKVAKSWKDKDGETHWSKHLTVMECWQTEKMIYWLGHVSHRQILPNEIILDLDDNPTIEKLNIICEELESKHHHYKAYFTGSRGYHIHINIPGFQLLNKRLKEQIRLDIIQEFGADLHKKNEVMIALEDVPHWKTGKLKQLIRSYPNE